jgi:hypothetical protein
VDVTTYAVFGAMTASQPPEVFLVEGLADNFKVFSPVHQRSLNPVTHPDRLCVPPRGRELALRVVAHPRAWLENY